MMAAASTPICMRDYLQGLRKKFVGRDPEKAIAQKISEDVLAGQADRGSPFSWSPGGRARPMRASCPAPLDH